MKVRITTDYELDTEQMEADGFGHVLDIDDSGEQTVYTLDVMPGRFPKHAEKHVFRGFKQEFESLAEDDGAEITIERISSEPGS